MKLTLKRYSLMLSLQTVFFIIDFCINICSVLVHHNNGLSLILFIIQITCLVMSIGSLFMTFFSTYAFQAGLIDLLYEKYYLSLIVFLLYFILTIFVQIFSLVVQWNHNLKLAIWSSTPLFVFFIIQRTMAPIYYYFYKRTSLTMSDPKLYEDMWNENGALNN